MKFNFFRFTLLFSVIVLLSSCLGTTETTDLSSNPSFSSLTFAANDSIPNIEDAEFTLEFDPLVGDSVIVNLDSLPYNTRIDSVFPTFGFVSSSAQYLIYENDTVLLDGSDTIDFSEPVKIRNVAADKIKTRVYTVKVNVHQVEPELYVWNKVSENVDNHDATSQKAIVFNDTIFYYLNNGSAAYLYKSTDGKSWSEQSVSGLPVNTSLNDMQLFNGKLYLTQDGDKVYSTSDRRNWTVKTNLDYTYKSLLFTFQNKLWAVVQSKNVAVNRFATSTDGVVWVIGDVIPTSFPVSGFTSLAFSSRTGKPKVIVLGGILSSGEKSNHCWTTEGEIVGGNMYWSDFNFDNTNRSLDTLAAGASLISYDKKLFVFGLRTDTILPHFKQSIDEGLTWQKPDSTYNYLPGDLEVRNYQSVFVFKPRAYNSTDSKEQNLESNKIFIIGGKTATSVKTDVWTGKLNRKNFLRQ